MSIDLDREYNTRLWAPDFAATIARHGLLGEAARARNGVLLDLRWGPGPRQTLDFFGVARAAGPLVLCIHGGYWQFRTTSKASVAFLAPSFLERGIAYCAVSYELCPEVTMDQMVGQLREAVRWVRANPTLLGYRVERLTAIGHSAGGHLAAMLALSPEGLVDAACGVSGLYELAPIANTYLNEPLRMDAAIAARNSPLLRVRENLLKPPPMVLGVGGLESPEFKRQAAEFGRIYPAPVFELAGKNHYDATEALAAPGPFQDAVMRIARCPNEP